MSLPIRSPSHQIDTLAVRRVLQHMPSDYLVRGIDERDYGIDLQFERFNGDTPTGQIAHIQVKGTNSEEESTHKIEDFPVKTIEYALLFSAPFFVVRVSLRESSLRFVWLQKYASKYLDVNAPAWRKQSTTTIKFPSENVLPGNYEKMTLILEEHARREDGLRFMSHLSKLESHYDALQNNSRYSMSYDSIKPTVQAANEHVRQLRKFESFVEKYSLGGETCDLKSIEGVIDIWAGLGNPDANDIAEADTEFEFLKATQKHFLHQDDIDEELELAISSESYHPY